MNQYDGPDLSEDVERRPSGLPTRNRRLPKRYRDEPPPLPAAVPPPMTADPGENEVLGDLAPGGLDFEVDIEPTASPRSPASSTSTPHTFHTESDSHDLFREYHGGFPSYDPENSMSLDHLSDGPTFHRAPASPLSSPCKNYFAPFLNATTWQLINWFYNSSPQKSLQDLDCLVQDVILADDFDRDDLHNFSAHRETKRLDDAPRNSSSSLFSADGWCTTSIPI